MNPNSIDASPDNAIGNAAQIDNTNDGARKNLQEAALKLYECKGGALVRHPSECYGLNVLPELTIQDS